MIYKKKDQKTEETQEVNKENPVALPEVSKETRQAADNYIETFLETASRVMEQHKGTLEKLRDSDLTETAFGIFKNKETGMWFLVEIKYDPLNGSTSPAEFTNMNDNSRDNASDRFRIAVANKLMV